MQKLALAILVFVAGSGGARAWGAQTPDAPVVDPSLALAGPVDGGRQPDSGVVEDPHADRAILLPTALTQPAGTVSISSYELLLAGLTVGITDRLQASATAVLPFEGARAVFGNLKFQVLKRGPLRLALNAGLSYIGDETLSSHDDEPSSPVVMPVLGASVSLCLTDDCQSLISGSVQFLTVAHNGPLGQTGAGFGGSLITRIGGRTKLIVEAGSSAEVTPAFDQAQAGTLSVALRYFRHQVALDGGVIAVILRDSMPAPLPYAAASVRF